MSESLGTITPIPIPAGERAGVTVLLFGGTFDPVHKAHVELGQEARQWVESPNGRPGQPGGAWLVLVPAARSPHKTGAPGACASKRIEMLRLAFAGCARAAVWTDELDRQAASRAASYTIDTVRRARQWLDAQGAKSAKLRLLIGADQAAAFHTWREPHEILKLAPPVVMARSLREDPQQLLAAIRATGKWAKEELETWSTGLANTSVMDIAATDVRRALAEGRWQQAAEQLAPAVLDFIRMHRLYQGEKP